MACVLSCFSHVPLFVTPWTVAHQPPLSMGFPGKNIGVGFPDKNTGVGCRFLLQGIFPTQGSKPGFLHCRQTLYCLSHQGSRNNEVVLLFPSPVDHVLSELTTMIHPSWVNLHGMAYSFIDLYKPLHYNKALIHEGWCLKSFHLG